MFQGSYEKETLRPLTIKQILDAEEIHTGGETMLDGLELTRMCFIGQVRNISKQTTNTTFKMDDGTGTMEAKDWNDIDAPMYDEAGNPLQSNKESIEVGDWAKIYGNIKFSNNRKHVTASVMKKIKDKNEINYHLLEATYVHLFLTRGPPGTLSGEANTDGNVYGQQQQSYGAANGGTVGTDAQYQNQLQGMNAAANKVFNCIRSDAQTNKSNEGLHTQDIAARVGLPIDTVTKACYDLSNESLLFNTVDDETWSILEM